MTRRDAPPIVTEFAADDPLLTGAEVARTFRVDPKTVARWALEGRVAYVATPSGRRMYRQSVIRAVLEQGGGD